MKFKWPCVVLLLCATGLWSCGQGSLQTATSGEAVTMTSVYDSYVRRLQGPNLKTIAALPVGIWYRGVLGLVTDKSITLGSSRWHGMKTLLEKHEESITALDASFSSMGELWHSQGYRTDSALSRAEFEAYLADLSKAVENASKKASVGLNLVARSSSAPSQSNEFNPFAANPKDALRSEFAADKPQPSRADMAKLLKACYSQQCPDLAELSGPQLLKSANLVGKPNNLANVKTK